MGKRRISGYSSNSVDFIHNVTKIFLIKYGIYLKLEEFKVYQEINKAIDQLISEHKKTINVSDHITERDTHYFIQGLEVAKLLVDQTQEIDVEEVPYETFENIVQILSNHLEKEDMEEIIAETFSAKEDEDGQ